jgi:enoyl-CoA hydratase/carnithine racemase
MDLKFLLYEIKDKIALITINSPKTLNAINDDIIEELYQAITAAEQDENVRVMVLTGAGKAFCAGGELGFMKKGIEDGTIDLAAMMKNSSRLPVAMKTSSKPIICAVRGAAAGAGCSMALCSDFCFASDNAKFIEAFIGVGLLADTGGLFALSKAVGDVRAVQLCMTGEPVSAERALEYGIAYMVVPEAELEERVMKFAARLAAGPSSCYRAIKQMEWETGWKGYRDYLALEQKLQVECGASPNFREGVFAFLERRPPKFQ